MSKVDEGQAATVRELIIKLAEVEDAIRTASGHGTTPEVVELAHAERDLVAALRERHVPVALGRMAQEVISGESEAITDGNVGPEPGEPPMTSDAAFVAERVDTGHGTEREVERTVADRALTARAQGVLMARYRLTATGALEGLDAAAHHAERPRSWVAEHVVRTMADAADLPTGRSDRASPPESDPARPRDAESPYREHVAHR